jgi:hypothetical protein
MISVINTDYHPKQYIDKLVFIMDTDCVLYEVYNKLLYFS